MLTHITRLINGYIRVNPHNTNLTRIDLFIIMFVTPQTRGSVESTRGIQVDVGLPDATSENRVESPLYGELALYPNTTSI